MMNPYNRVNSWSYRLRQLGLTALLAGGTTVAAHAQFNYAAGQTINPTGTFTDLGTTGTAIATADTDDSNSAAQNIGFTFNYNGTAFTQFVLNTNGLIRLGASPPSKAAAHSIYAQTPDLGPAVSTDPADVNLIMPFNIDLVAGSSAAGTSYRVAVTGTSPNRVCTIQWTNVADKATNASATVATSITTQYDNFSFQVKLYETTNQIDFVYGLPTAGTGASNIKFIAVGLKGSGSAAGQDLLATKASTGLWSTTTFFSGPYTSTANAHNVRQTVLPDAGRTYRFQATQANDAAVSAIYTLGKLPVPAGLPATIQVAVRNAGSAALTNLPVTLSVTGANTFGGTQTVATLAPGASTLVSFAYPATLATGINNMTATVPDDAVLTNNSATWQQSVNNTATFSYVPNDQTTDFTSFGGGVNGLIIAAKYTTTTVAAVSTVRVYLDDANSVGKTVAGVVLTTAGVIQGRSADYVVTTADIGTYKTFAISSPPTVAAGGSFLVGLQQVAYTGAQYFPVGAQVESPARTATYYTIATAGGTPNDFAAQGYRPMIEAQTSAPVASDAAVANIYTLGKIITPAGLPHAVQALVTNTGTAAITNLAVTLNVTGANTFTNTQTVATLAAGATATVTFAAYPATLALGTNTVTVTIPNDGNNNNNLLAVQQLINATRQSYIAPNETAPTSALGNGTSAGILASKFTASSPLYISSVSDYILNTTSSPVGHTMYAVVLSSTGAILGRSADYVVTTADLGAVKTLDLTTAVTVPTGDYYVGIAQAASATAFYPVGLIAENPTRTGAFFAFDLTGGTPQDLASYNFGRYMIEAISVIPPACSGPTALAASNITATGATITFTPPAGGAASYQLVYGPTGFDPTAGGTTVAVTGSPYTLTGLSSATTYQVYVRTVCTGGGNSAYVGPISLSTPCGATTVTTFPYLQNFDAIAAGQSLPCGITVLDANADGTTWATSTDTPYSGTRAMRYNGSTLNNVAADDWFFTPALALAPPASTTRYQVAFRYRALGIGTTGTSNYTESLEVKSGATATVAGQTNLLYTNNSITNLAYNLANGTSAPAVAYLPAGTSTQFVGFHVKSIANQGSLYIDDLSVTAVTVTATTSENLLKAVSVFPNPSTGVFDLEIHGANAKGSLGVVVTNTLGQQVYVGTARDNYTNKLDLGGLAPGLYHLQVRNGDETLTRQIAVVK